MPTFEVVSGDTVWGLTRRALTDQLGRRPTNAEILEVVNQVQVPSGNVDLIFPGEQITIPVGPGYDAPDIQEDPDSVGPPPAPRPDVPPGGGPGDRPGERLRPVPPRGPGDRPGDVLTDPNEGLRFAPPLMGPGAFDSFRAPGNEVGNYRDFHAGSLGDWGDLLSEVVGDVGMFAARGVGRVPLPRPGLPALPSGARPALPSGARPALPAGPAGRPALPAGPGGGPRAGGAARRARFPSENEIRALRQPQTRGFR